MDSSSMDLSRALGEMPAYVQFLQFVCVRVCCTVLCAFEKLHEHIDGNIHYSTIFILICTINEFHNLIRRKVQIVW